jgi:hypothetical protein
MAEIAVVERHPDAAIRLPEKYAIEKRAYRTARTFRKWAVSVRSTGRIVKYGG